MWPCCMVCHSLCDLGALCETYSWYLCASAALCDPQKYLKKTVHVNRNHFLTRKSTMANTASQDEVVMFMQQLLESKLQSPPPAAGSAEAFQAEAEWAARWGAWMRPFNAAPAPSAAPGAPACALGLRERLIKLGTGPAVFACPGFCSDEECDELIRLGVIGSVEVSPGAGWSPAWRGREVAKAMLQMTPREAATRAQKEAGWLRSMLAERVGVLTGCDSLWAQTGGDGSTQEIASGCQLSFSAPEGSGGGGATIGLHVDQNNGARHRWATVLIYLNTIEPSDGGCTVFPCVAAADTEPPGRPVRSGSALEPGLETPADATPAEQLSTTPAGRHADGALSATEASPGFGYVAL